MTTGTGALLLLPDVTSQGGIQQHGRNLLAAFGAAGLSARAVVLHGTTSLPMTDRLEQLAWPCGGSRTRFVWRAAIDAARRRSDVVLIGHRAFLPLAPLLRLAAPSSRLWRAAYGIDVEAPFTRFERAALACLEQVVAISPWTRSLVLQAGYRGPVELLPCSLPPGASPASAALAQVSSPLRLLTVTRLSAAEGYKGVDTIIEAVAALRTAGMLARLRVVGEGDDRPRLEQLASQLGVAADVDFLGASDGPARDAEYVACDAFVLPSTREGFGLVFLEAMLHARPVVACDAGGAPFVVRPEAGGWLARPSDAMHLAELLASLVRRPDLARSLGEQGRDLALSEFSFPRLVQGVRDLIRAPSATGEAAT